MPRAERRFSAALEKGGNFQKNLNFLCVRSVNQKLYICMEAPDWWSYPSFVSKNPAFEGLRGDIAKARKVLDQTWTFRNLAKIWHHAETFFCRIQMLASPAGREYLNTRIKCTEQPCSRRWDTSLPRAYVFFNKVKLPELYDFCRYFVYKKIKQLSLECDTCCHIQLAPSC